MGDYWTYHGDRARTGMLRPSGASAPNNSWRQYATIPTAASVRGAVLVLEDYTFAAGPRAGQTANVLIVTSSANEVICCTEEDLRSGNLAPVWHVVLGKPLARPGSNIPPPIGISSTPVADRAARRVYILPLVDLGPDQLVWSVIAETNWRNEDTGITVGSLERRPVWSGRFADKERRELLAYTVIADGGLVTGDWVLVQRGVRVANTSAQLAALPSTAPTWIGDFLGTGTDQVILYDPSTAVPGGAQPMDWWLGRYDTATGKFDFTRVGNTTGFGQVDDGRPFWVGDFGGVGRSQILFYYPGNGDWQLGTVDLTKQPALQWSSLGHTRPPGSPDLGDSSKYPTWVGNFTGTGQAELLIYNPATTTGQTEPMDWWLGRYDTATGKFDFTRVGNTTGFGQVDDGRPFWVGDFGGVGRLQILFYYPGNGDWQLGTVDLTKQPALQWSSLGHTRPPGSPDLGDSSKYPTWVGNFTGTGQAELLIYNPATTTGQTEPMDWWLGRYDTATGKFDFTRVGNTTGFGQVDDGRPFWVGDFEGNHAAAITFWNPGNGYFHFGMLCDPQYRLTSLDIDTGSTQAEANLVDPAGGFYRLIEDQRGGLNLSPDGAWLYATFADFQAYDFDQYRGWVVRASTVNLKQQEYWPSTSVNALGGGIWGPGGAALSPSGDAYVVTGNSLASAEYWQSLGFGCNGPAPATVGDFFEAIVRLDGNSFAVPGQATHPPAPATAYWCQPKEIKQIDGQDQDLGGSSVALLPQNGGRSLAVTTGKDSCVYLVDASNLGGFGNELARLLINQSAAESKCAPACYEAPDGQLYVYVVAGGTPGLVAYRVDASGNTFVLTQAWAALTLGDAPGSPTVVQLPSGSVTAAVVWVVDDITSRARAFDALSGAGLQDLPLTAGGSASLPHYPALSAAGSSIFVAMNHGVACLGP